MVGGLNPVGCISLLSYLENDMPLSIATDEAIQMIEKGWTVRYLPTGDEIEWRSPRGISGSDYRSCSLDCPPLAAVEDARRHNDIVDRSRVPCDG